MKDPIESKVESWDKFGNNRFSEINLKIIHLDEWLFSDYEPQYGPNKSFMTRLNAWLENIPDQKDQQTLFELVPNIFYVGREELNVLYREAYNTNYITWLIDTLNLSFTNTLAENEKIITEAINDTWFCPLTDSLRINQFYHINDISGKHDYRPDWRSLVKFGDVNKVTDYIEEQKIRRIVLLEDFIGNGGQVSKAVLFAAENLKNIPVLIIPLILCPAGAENSEALEHQYPGIKIRPVISVPSEYFVDKDNENNRNELFKRLNILANKTYAQVADSNIIDDDIDPYGPFGWRKTGGLIVMHTNTPNNSLPLIHNQSPSWSPLFKRHKRK